MRLIWAKLRPGAGPQLEAKYTELGRRVPGLKARWLVRDVNEPDAFFSLSVWDSVASIEAWENSEDFKNVYLPSLRPFIEGEYTASICEIRHAEEFVNV